ncbi:MAG: hypothetical protein ACRC3B_23335, partial [Bacteroidia bacterium]
MKFAPLLFIISISFFSCIGERGEQKNLTTDNSIVETYDSTQIKLLHTEFENLRNKAEGLKKSGKIREAIVADSLALAVAEKIGTYSKCIETVRSLESSYNLENNKVQAIQICYKGINIAEKNKDIKTMADFYSSIGLSYFYVNDFEKALPAHLKSLELSKQASYS